jgi:antitoxin HigA-1
MKRSPPHPGPGIRDDLEALGLSVAEGAAGLGVSRQQLHNVISGKSAITPEMALRLEKGLGGTAEGWIALQSAHDLAAVRANAGKLGVMKLAPKLAEPA